MMDKFLWVQQLRCAKTLNRADPVSNARNLEFMNDGRCRADGFGDVDHMAVMGQVDCLAAPTDGFHNAAGSTGACLVKGFENIITEKRQRRALGHELFMRCGA